MNILFNYVSLLYTGLYQTITLWLGALCISMLGGTFLGILNNNIYAISWLSPLINLYIWILRGIPVYVQILIIYFVLPDLLNINLSAYWAAIIALGACSTAYTAEIIRSGINAVDKGQWEACTALGFSRIQTLWHVILPQMIKMVLPALANEWEALIKSTSIVSAIGVMELTRVGQNIIAHTMQPVPVYITIALLYLCLSTLLTFTTRFIEKQLLIS